MKVNLEFVQTLIEDAEFDDLTEIAKMVNNRRKELREAEQTRIIRQAARETLELTKELCSTERTVSIIK
jgi:hypothetical protein